LCAFLEIVTKFLLPRNSSQRCFVAEDIHW
jgi:hypothetical protein